ncbi:zinc finger protein 40-like [Macrobrachium nipponense]|uniref:zinc finger protein 40-like n=1 Tax=Macrobrachium nipponense TaxID=159736 RepID=UPI0030C82C9E
MLICESSHFRIHRVIVSSVSNYLKKKFEDGHQLLVLEDIKSEILSLVLKFIYGGYVEVKENNLPAFIKAAKFLQINNIWCNEDIEKDLQNGNDAFQRKPQNLDKSALLSDHEAPEKDDQITLEEKLKKNGVLITGNRERTLLGIPAWLLSSKSVSISTTVQSDKKKENRLGSHMDTSHQASDLDEEPYYLGTVRHQQGKRKYDANSFSPQKWLNYSSYKKVISPLHPLKESVMKSHQISPSTHVKNCPPGLVKTRQPVLKNSTTYKVSDVPKPQKINYLTPVSPNHKENCITVPVQAEEPPVRKINYAQPTHLTEVEFPDCSEKSSQIDSSITHIASETLPHIGNNEEIVLIIDGSLDIVEPEVIKKTESVTLDFSEHLYEELPDLEDSPFIGFETPDLINVNMENDQTLNEKTLTTSDPWISSIERQGPIICEQSTGGNVNENVTDTTKKGNDQQEEPQDQTPDGMMTLTPFDPLRSSNESQGPITRKWSKSTVGNVNENVTDIAKKKNKKTIVCGFCKTRCNNKMALEMHMRTHIGKKYYTCSSCTYKAVTKKALQNHIARTHRRKVLLNDEKTYNIF